MSKEIFIEYIIPIVIMLMFSILLFKAFKTEKKKDEPIISKVIYSSKIVFVFEGVLNYPLNEVIDIGPFKYRVRGINASFHPRSEFIFYVDKLQKCGKCDFLSFSSSDGVCNKCTREDLGAYFNGVNK